MECTDLSRIVDSLNRGALLDGGSPALHQC